MSPRLLKNANVHDELLADGGMVLFDTATRRVITLNSTAAFVWECCDGTRSETAIADEVRALFPDAAPIDVDVAAILQDFRSQGLIGDAG